MAEQECWWFRWVGQPFYTCDGCGEPAWEHRGDLKSTGPFSPTEAVPWPEGHADAIRRKWEPAMVAAGYVPPSRRSASVLSGQPEADR